MTDYLLGKLLQCSLTNSHLPTKHAGIFHPSLINTKNWTLNPPDWNNPDIFKVGIPGIVGFNFTKHDENEKWLWVYSLLN